MASTQNTFEMASIEDLAAFLENLKANPNAASAKEHGESEEMLPGLFRMIFSEAANASLTDLEDFLERQVASENEQAAAKEASDSTPEMSAQLGAFLESALGEVLEGMPEFLAGAFTQADASNEQETATAEAASELKDEVFYTPAANVHKDEDNIVISVDLPGVDAENDVIIELHSDTVTIEAFRAEPKGSAEGNPVGQPYGKARVAVQLPKEVSEEAISATYEFGVLTVTVADALKEEVVEVPRIRVNVK